MRYNANVSPFKFLPLGKKFLIITVFLISSTISLTLIAHDLSPTLGERFLIILIFLAILSLISVLMTYFICKNYPPIKRIEEMVKQRLFDPRYGNPLHFKHGDILPLVKCEELNSDVFSLCLSCQESVSSEALISISSIISSALRDEMTGYAITETVQDSALSYVMFKLIDVSQDNSLVFIDENSMKPQSSTLFIIDKTNYLDLKASGSILIVGKTRSGKTTGAISLLIQALLIGPDNFNSKIVIIDPKQAELSRLPFTITLDEEGEALPILTALKDFISNIKSRQDFLNKASALSGDAVKWWDLGMHPSLLFIDEYVALRSVFPKKSGKDSDYCLETFDKLLKRIVTTGASAGCFVIVSIAEASVQEGGLPSMLKAAMSTKILFRPTKPEAALLWDTAKIDVMPQQIYQPGDAWFSSTDGVHDGIAFVHFPRMHFPVYKILDTLLKSYNQDTDTH